eukprot:SM000133S26776  [mRNA]  locus=s133:3946:8536:- [translate_table: standard]
MSPAVPAQAAAWRSTGPASGLSALPAREEARPRGGQGPPSPSLAGWLHDEPWTDGKAEPGAAAGGELRPSMPGDSPGQPAARPARCDEDGRGGADVLRRRQPWKHKERPAGAGAGDTVTGGGGGGGGARAGARHGDEQDAGPPAEEAVPPAASVGVALDGFLRQLHGGRQLTDADFLALIRRSSGRSGSNHPDGTAAGPRAPRQPAVSSAAAPSKPASGGMLRAPAVKPGAGRCPTAASVVALAQVSAKASTDPLGWPLSRALATLSAAAVAAPATSASVQLEECKDPRCRAAGRRRFCAPLNWRRHGRLHLKSHGDREDFRKDRPEIAAFLCRATPAQSAELLHLADTSIQGIKGGRVMAQVRLLLEVRDSCHSTGEARGPLADHLRAGAALVEVVDAGWAGAGSGAASIQEEGGIKGAAKGWQQWRSGSMLDAGGLLAALDCASEGTFLQCGTAAQALQRGIFAGPPGAPLFGLDERNVVATLAFFLEHRLVQVWMGAREAEALRRQEALVEEEEAAQKKQSKQVQRKRSRRLRLKEQRGRERGSERGVATTQLGLSPSSGSSVEPLQDMPSPRRPSSPPPMMCSPPLPIFGTWDEGALLLRPVCTAELGACAATPLPPPPASVPIMMVGSLEVPVPELVTGSRAMPAADALHFFAHGGVAVAVAAPAAADEHSLLGDAAVVAYCSGSGLLAGVTAAAGGDSRAWSSLPTISPVMLAGEHIENLSAIATGASPIEGFAAHEAIGEVPAVSAQRDQQTWPGLAAPSASSAWVPLEALLVSRWRRACADSAAVQYNYMPTGTDGAKAEGSEGGDIAGEGHRDGALAQRVEGDTRTQTTAGAGAPAGSLPDAVMAADSAVGRVAEMGGAGGGGGGSSRRGREQVPNSEPTWKPTVAVVAAAPAEQGQCKAPPPSTAVATRLGHRPWAVGRGAGVSGGSGPRRVLDRRGPPSWAERREEAAIAPRGAGRTE